MKAARNCLIKCSDALLDAVYVPQCALCGRPGVALCSLCLDEMRLNPVQLGKRGHLNFAIPIYAYSGKAARAVQRLKFDRVTGLAKPMSQELSKIGNRFDSFFDTFVIPVPIHWSRRFQRGFNQSELLCTAMEAPIRPQWLKRTRATRPQAGLSVDQRRRDLEGAFAAAPEVRGKRILLLDDVMTTGHTAQACAETLVRAGALEVGMLAFAGNP